MARMVLIAVALFVSPAFAGELTATDGDSLRLAGERIRLWGVDAPELGQSCRRDGQKFDCVAFAGELPRSLIGDDQVECEAVETDRFGRTVAHCRVGGLDLDAMMVKAGWALEFERYSGGYYAYEQDRARLAGAAWHVDGGVAVGI